MRKSKADTAETRKKIIATASNVFLRNGLAATGISDVMVAAGLTQGGFYRHFDSKEHLIAEANAAAFDDLLSMFDAAAVGKSPREALDIIVNRYIFQLQQPALRYLCPLANLSTELSHADDQIKAVVSDGYARIVKLLASHLMRLDYSDYVGVAEAMVATMVGAVSLARLAVEPAASDAILSNARKTVTFMLESSPTSKSLLKSTH
jgi:TetR/AcrR family transcriptional repressor of nem operon